MSDITGLGSALNSYYDMTSSNAKATQAADKVSSKTSGLTKESSRSEIEGAVKSFESYFLEQILKNEKEMLTTFSGEDEDKDLYASQIEDMYMDKTIQSVSEDIVDKYAGNLTDDLADQIQRNLGVSEAQIKADR
ncbi:MAG: hypothetical protein VZQ80_07245 [Lachnospiraceae bacterium]|nr:hypothetical protein [Lachnospiraceae bacterium]